jgi:hypothetical protein
MHLLVCTRLQCSPGPLLVTWGAARRWPPTPVWRQRHGRAARSITSRCVPKAGNPHGAHRAICPRPGSQRITSALSELRTEIGVYDPATLRLFSVAQAAAAPCGLDGGSPLYSAAIWRSRASTRCCYAIRGAEHGMGMQKTVTAWRENFFFPCIDRRADGRFGCRLPANVV